MLFLLTLLLISSSAFTAFHADPPDTLIIEMEQVKGFGGISPSSGLSRELDPGSPWFPAQPEVTGIPADLDDYSVMVEKTDFVQHAFQSYKAGLLDSAFVMNAFESWDDAPSNYSSEYLDIYTGILVWEEDEKTHLKIANKLPLDFSRSETITLPEPDGFLNPDDMLITEITYELYLDGQVHTKTDWFRISKGPDLSSQGITGTVLFTGSYSHRKGVAEVQGTRYTILLDNNFSGTRFNQGNTNLYVLYDDNDEMTNATFGQMVRFGDIPYRFAGVSTNGSRVTLKKIDDADAVEGTQTGLKAYDFSHETIDGDELTLSGLEGNYVFLDFWGTWCAPCIEEMPYLKEAYRLFRGEGFEMVGIAYDQPETLHTFIDEWEIEWPQILQAPGASNEIIERYNINAFPTTFLLDPELVIQNTGLRNFQIEQKLAESLEISAAVQERIRSGNHLVEIEATDAEAVHISGKDLPFSGRIPLYNLDGIWTRGFALDPGVYYFSVYKDGELSETNLPGRTTGEDGSIVYKMEISE